VLAQQTIAASSDARHAPPMAPDADMRLALDDVTLADLECRPDHAATAVEYLVIPVELSPAGIVVTARPLTRPWFFLGVAHG
jgi:hypothetical protein